jgi:DNA-binding MarR family transcriptional regulator
MNPAGAGIANELALAMMRLRARLRLESAPQGAGWTWSQVTTLSRIVAEGPSTVTQLARAEHVRPQSMAESVAALRREGLVTGSQDPDDRRKVRLEATEKGRALAAAIPALREAWLQAAITAALDDDERAQLGAAVLLLNRLADWPGGEPES